MTHSVPPPPDAPEDRELLKAGRGFLQPDIWIVASGSGRRVWKSWHRRPAWERATFGKWLARREGRIMRRLGDLDGFPRFLGHPHPWTLEMSLLDAEPVPEEKRGSGLSPLYFDRLAGMLGDMHERGVNHGDLRRKNLLRAPGDPDTPRIVDFTQSLCVRTPPTGLTGWVFREAIRIDRVTFLKLKRWFLGSEALTARETQEGLQIPWHLKSGQFLRRNLYRPFKRWRRQRDESREARNS